VKDPRGATGLGAVALAVLLAGCGAAATPPDGSPATVTDAPASLATPIPGEAEADGVLRAFGALVRREDLTFHVVERLSTTGGGAQATLTIDVAGSDFAATIKVPGEKAVELRHVGGLTFARVGNGRWRAGTADDRLLDEVTDPWLYLCWLDDLEYTGPSVGPAGGFAYECSGPFAYQSPMMRSFGKTGRVESVALVLDADGAPVSMTVSGAGPTLASDGDTFRAEMTFSAVGEPVVVKVPKT
jgi:hypothetical protein